MVEVTDPKVAFVFDVIDKADVSQTDFARLTRISRETLYRWRTGGRITDRLRLDIAYSYALRMEKAIAAKRLPIPDRLKKEQRVGALRQIIADMASK